MTMPDRIQITHQPRTMTTPNIRTALERLVELDKRIEDVIPGIEIDNWIDAMDAARAALDEPEGEGPTPIDYRRWHDAHSEECNTWSEQLTPPLNLRTTVEALAWAKHCLARWGRHAPAPKPIPVSERPWERDGWRDTEGRCWFCNAYSMGRWNYQLPPDSEQDWGMLGTETHCLPHWAIARPRPEAKG